MSNLDPKSARTVSSAEQGPPAVFTPLMPLQTCVPWAKPATPDEAEVRERPRPELNSSEAKRPINPDDAETSSIPAAPQWLIDLRFSTHTDGEFILDPDYKALLVRRNADHMLMSFSEAVENIKGQDPDLNIAYYDTARAAGWTHLAVALNSRPPEPSWLQGVLCSRRASAALAASKCKTLVGIGAGADAVLEMMKLLPDARVLALFPRNLSKLNSLGDRGRSALTRLAVVLNPQLAARFNGPSEVLWPSLVANPALPMAGDQQLELALKQFVEKVHCP